jgi:hypothetical protein
VGCYTGRLSPKRFYRTDLFAFRGHPETELPSASTCGTKGSSYACL